MFSKPLRPSSVAREALRRTRHPLPVRNFSVSSRRTTAIHSSTHHDRNQVAGPLRARGPSSSPSPTNVSSPTTSSAPSNASAGSSYSSSADHLFPLHNPRRHFFSALQQKGSPSFSALTRIFSKSANATPHEPFVGVTQLYQAEHFPVLAEQAVERAKEKMARVLSRELNPRQLIKTLDDVSSDLCDVADAAELARNVHPDDEWVDCANAAVNIVASYMSEVNLDDSVFRILEEAEKDMKGLNDEEVTVLTHMREAMQNEGVGMQGEGRRLGERMIPAAMSQMSP